MNWRWISKAAALAIHSEQISEHGGARGVRDEGLLESALDRPRNLSAYGDVGAAELAAAYAFGIACNHPFIDGNKRMAFIVSVTFLLKNGFDIIASERDVVETFWNLSAGEMTEKQLAAWFTECSVRVT